MMTKKTLAGILYTIALVLIMLVITGACQPATSPDGYAPPAEVEYTAKERIPMRCYTAKTSSGSIFVYNFCAVTIEGISCIISDSGLSCDWGPQ